MRAMPTIRQLQFLLALSRRESFSKAADDCLVSQSTLSAAIKELETVLDCQIVDRSGRSFQLTRLGAEIVGKARDIVAATEDLVQHASCRDILSGAFQLGVIPTIAPFVIPNAAKALRQEYPALELHLREDLTDPLMERLSSGSLDAVLIAFPYHAEGIEHEYVGSDAFVFAAAPDHPLMRKSTIESDDLQGQRLLLLEDGHCLRGHAIDACGLKDNASDRLGATSLLTLSEMAAAGLGVTLLPELAVQSGLASAAGLEIRPFSPPSPSREIGLAWRKGSPRQEDAKALAAVIRRILSPEA